MRNKIAQLVCFALIFSLCQEVGASAEKSLGRPEGPHITLDTRDQIPFEGGWFTFESVKLSPLNHSFLSFTELANNLQTIDRSGQKPLDPVHIFTLFKPAKGSQKEEARPTFIYLPGSAGINQSEVNIMDRLTERGCHVFAINTNYSHAREKYPNYEEAQLKKKASTSENQLGANPLNQVADTTHLCDLIEGLPYVDAAQISLLGNSLGGVSALMAAMPEFVGPLTNGAGLVNDRGTLEYDLWYSVRRFKAVISTSGALPILPREPHFTPGTKVIVITGAEDNYCEPLALLNALKFCQSEVFAIVLEGVGHFPEASREEYERRVKNSTKGGIVYRSEQDDFFIKNGQNISPASFVLGQRLSAFQIKKGEDPNDYMVRMNQNVTFLHRGEKPHGQGEEKKFGSDYLKLYQCFKIGTSIKPDPVATNYMIKRIFELLEMPNVEYRVNCYKHAASLDTCEKPEDFPHYRGYVTRKMMAEKDDDFLS